MTPYPVMPANHCASDLLLCLLTCTCQRAHQAQNAELERQLSSTTVLLGVTPDRCRSTQKQLQHEATKYAMHSQHNMSATVCGTNVHFRLPLVRFCLWQQTLSVLIITVLKTSMGFAHVAMAMNSAGLCRTAVTAIQHVPANCCAVISLGC